MTHKFESYQDSYRIHCTSHTDSYGDLYKHTVMYYTDVACIIHTMIHTSYKIVIVMHHNTLHRQRMKNVITVHAYTQW